MIYLLVKLYKLDFKRNERAYMDATCPSKDFPKRYKPYEDMVIINIAKQNKTTNNFKK